METLIPLSKPNFGQDMYQVLYRTSLQISAPSKNNIYIPPPLKIYRHELYPKTSTSKVLNHALSRALSRFATEPQREGHAALVHIKQILSVS